MGGELQGCHSDLQGTLWDAPGLDLSLQEAAFRWEGECEGVGLAPPHPQLVSRTPPGMDLGFQGWI